jgi:tRNA G37 N-methylase Trm5
VGANEGIYTLFFLTRTSARKVFAFEPAADALRLFERNLYLNRLSGDPRLEIVKKFVGNTDKPDCTSLGTFSDAIVSPCLIKVDIDGGEVDLLEGAQKLLRSPGFRWIIEVHSVALERRCIEILREANYRIVVVDNAWWRVLVPELRSVELNRWLIAARLET